jgi:hypothetical protein
MKVSGAAAGGGSGETPTHVHRIGVAGTPAQAALVSSEPTCIPSATEHLNGGVVAFALVGMN